MSLDAGRDCPMLPPVVRAEVAATQGDISEMEARAELAAPLREHRRHVLSLARLSVRGVGAELHSYPPSASVCRHGQMEGRDVCGSDLVNNHGSKTPLRAVRTIVARKIHCSNDSRSQEWADLHHKALFGVDRRDVRTELQGPQLDGAGDLDAVRGVSGYPNRSSGGYNPNALGRLHRNDARGRVDQLPGTKHEARSRQTEAEVHCR